MSRAALRSRPLSSERAGDELQSLSPPVDAPRKRVTDLQRTDAAKQRANLSRLPRYLFFTNGFKLEPATKQFCGGSLLSNKCNWPAWAEGVLLTAGLAFVVAVLALVLCPIVCALRCCGCCGGCKRTYGYLLPGAERTDGYSPRSVWMTRAAILCIAVMVVISFAIMQVGNSGVAAGIESFATRTNEQADGLRQGRQDRGRHLVDAAKVSTSAHHAVAKGQHFDARALEVHDPAFAHPVPREPVEAFMHLSDARVRREHLHHQVGRSVDP